MYSFIKQKVYKLHKINVAHKVYRVTHNLWTKLSTKKFKCVLCQKNGGNGEIVNCQVEKMS